MIRLEFTRDEVRELLRSQNPIILDKVLRLVEQVGSIEIEHDLVSVIPLQWRRAGIKDEMLDRFIEVLRVSGKIPCIKEVRCLTGMGLKEAKDCVEQFIAPLVKKEATSTVVADEEEL